MDSASLYILNQPEPYRSILFQLQIVIEQTIKDVELLYKYKIPFYYIRGKPFCYLNVTKGYVDLGFWHAAHLTKHVDLMHSSGRKYMKSLRYYSPKDIDATILIAVLEQAYEVRDKKFYK